MMKRSLKLGAVCLGMAVLLCACGKGSTESTEAASSETETAQSEAVSETVAETEDTNVYPYEYDVESMVKLGEYKGLTYTETDVSVSDDEVESQINSTLTAHATAEQITDRAVEDGDTVNIDFEGKIDGKTFDGGTASGASLTIGSGTFIDGFEDGLIGVKPGDKTTLKLKFPDEYKTNTDLAGKDVTFDVTVNYIKGDDIVPELDDDFVKGLNIDDVSNVKEYRAYVKSQLQANKESEAEKSKQSELLQQAVDNAEIKEIPEELVTQYATQYTDYYKQYASYFGLELSDFLTQYMNQTEEEFNQSAEDYGKERAGYMLVVSAIAKAEKVDVDALYDEKVAQYAEQSGYADAATLEKDYSKRYLNQIIINEEVQNILEENAKAVVPAETESETSK
ncbi:MAG: trigger factor [Coprococcus sp.]|uniref:trigger factor n=1 Tax=Coprococcus catus TaxID=116085 RepID=UPI001C024DE3|nr:trigger factor [Coprococcus catus]MEE0141144.1 trigger factor [Coprococcus sp.]